MNTSQQVDSNTLNTSMLTGGGSNCLSLFRYLACLNVLFGHLSHHLNYPLPGWIDDILSLFPGVPIFFFLSGFLIWNLIIRTPDFKKYFTKRIFRIYPELWICVVVELLAIFLTYDKTVGLGTYLLFGVTQGTLFQFWTPEVLRGWGVGVPNGSLWTITVIVQFYILIWCGREFIRKASAKGLIWILFALVLAGYTSNVQTEDNEALSAKLLNNTCIPYLWIFFLGVLISKYFQKI